jgi:PAS domain S-box-containing protein
MTQKPTYDELEKRIQEFEKEVESLKRSEADLRSREQQLSKIFHGSPDTITITRISDGTFIDVNETFKSMFGISRKDAIGKTSVELELWPDTSTREEIVAKINDEGCVHNLEFKHRRSSGELLYVSASAELVTIGQETYILAHIRDISERKKTEADRRQAEMALRESEEKYRKLFENSVAPILNTLSDGTIEDANPACEDLLGVERNGLEGSNILDFYANPEDRMEFKRTMNEKGSVQDYPIPFKKKDGTLLHCLATVSVHNRLKDGKENVGFRGTLRDITREQKLQKQLTQAQKMEAIGTLAGGIAHDFNNMLGVITGNISYALSSLNKDDELYEVLIDVQESSKQAQGLTQQLLTFSKGGAPIKKVADINKIIKDAAIFSIRGANSKCNFELTDDLWTSEVDESQINQVVNNLVINAKQAMPNGGEITIRTENVTIETESDIPLPAGKYIKIEIEDQGVGISKSHLSNIFEPYFTTKQKGSGLGLATTYSIIKRHEGHIWVYSEIDKGTIFNIYLPASKSELAISKKVDQVIHTGHGSVLIMDDQTPILKMLTRILTAMGYETTTTLDGSEAIEVFQSAYQAQNPFDLVILDLTVPGGLGGAKVIPELLKIDPKVKAIVSSGYSNDPIMANYQDYGFCGVIPKPLQKAQLAELLNIIFGEND